MKEGRRRNEHWVFYVTDESVNSTSETNHKLHVNQLNLNFLKKIQILLACQGWRLRLCISKEFPRDAGTGGSQASLRKTRKMTFLSSPEQQQTSRDSSTMLVRGPTVHQPCHGLSHILALGR